MAQDIKVWLKSGKRHAFYKKTVEYSNEMRVHSDGIYPEKLIGERRPSESITIKNYREKIFSPITKKSFGKVFSSLQKIRKSYDYVINFEQSKVPSRIAEDEKPEVYFKNKYPKYGSLDNWFWSVGFREQLIDPNAIVFCNILNYTRAENEYAKTYATVYNSPDILDYSDDNFYFLKSNESHYYQDKGKYYEGEVYYYIDTNVIERFSQTDNKKNFAVDEFAHNLGYLPIVKLNGIIEKDNTENYLSHSRLWNIIPDFNEAVREYSDLQAEILMHVHSQLWAFSGQDCRKCKGVGKIKVAGKEAACDKCGGNGIYPFDPYNIITIKAPTAGESAVPTPPAGYIQKQTDIARLQDERVNKHIVNGLSAINYEWIMSTPLNQSGTAKEIDKSELNNFVYSVTEDAIRVIRQLHRTQIDMRYSGIVPAEKERSLMYPLIPVPNKFDIISEDAIANDITRMKVNKFNSKIIAAAEVEYAGKRFNTDTKLKDTVLAMFELDPLSGVSEDDLLMQLSSGGISKTDYFIHCNIKKLLDEVMEMDATFLQKPLKEKRETIEAKAKDEMDEMSGAKIVNDMLE